MPEEKKNSSTIGLENVVWAKLLTDTDSETTYGTVQALAGAIEATITPQNAEADVQYADNQEWDVLYPDPELELSLKMADIPPSVQAEWLGHATDSHGVTIKTAEDKPIYIAVGFKSEKTDHTHRYVWLYKCRAAPMTESYATKQGATITRQEPTINLTAIKRNSDGAYQATADEGTTGFAPASFLTTVYEKSAS